MMIEIVAIGIILIIYLILLAKTNQTSQGCPECKYGKVKVVGESNKQAINMHGEPAIESDIRYECAQCHYSWVSVKRRYATQKEFDDLA